MEDEEYSENDEIARQMRLERMRAIKQGGEGSADMGLEDQDMVQDVLDFEDVKGAVSQWI